MIKDLQNWLISNEGFQGKYQRLVCRSILDEFNAIEASDEILNASLDLDYLLTSASLLSGSDKQLCLEASLRIAQYCISNKNSSLLQKDAAAVILDGMANIPAIELAVKRNYLSPNITKRMPVATRIGFSRNKLEHSVLLEDSRIHVNKFQKEFWKSTQSNDWVSISAPTSVGKSYIMLHWIGEYLRKNPSALIAYIVPTRALIHQVEEDLKNYFLTQKTVPTVSTVPLNNEIDNSTANILVFTQERLHIFLTLSGVEKVFSAIIVDEAHKIGDGYRGILLQQTLEQIKFNEAKTKVIYASPLTNNPEVLISDSPQTISANSIVSQCITVNQNLFWVNQCFRKPKEWELILCREDKTNLGKIFLNVPPNTEGKRLVFVSHAIAGNSSGNVIYVNRAYDAETASELLEQLLDIELSSQEKRKLNALIDLIKKTIHPKFLLARVLKKGIAYHYGNIPLLIRNEIEKLFKEGVIKYLVCTSTLIEGVNMPCRNIFIRAPKRGLGNKMRPEDFWNLAGRAGRWGREFQGNIFCIDAQNPKLWFENEPPSKRKLYSIRKATDGVLADSEKLLNYISSSMNGEFIKDNVLEYMYSYLMSVYLKGNTIQDAPWASRYPSDVIGSIESKLSITENMMKISHETVLRNPGINPLAMNSMLDYFNNRTKPVEELLPVSASSDDAPNQFTAIFTRIDKYLNGQFGIGKSAYVEALLVTKWMRGYTLSRLISDRLKHYKKKGKTVKLPTIIRSTMNDVENIARFKAPKYLGCYIDILKEHLYFIEREDLADEIEELSIFLEFGVSQITQISFMGLGLSRTSTIFLTEHIVDDNLSKQECLDWLRKEIWKDMDIPTLAKEEIAMIIEREQSLS